MFNKKTAEEAIIEKMMKDMKSELENYRKKMKSLLSRDLDYVFLQQLINEVAEKNGEVEVHITLADGTKLDVMKPKREQIKRPSFD